MEPLQEVFVSLPTDAFDLDDFEGSLLEFDAALAAIKDPSVGGVLQDLCLFLDDLGISPVILRRPELYGHPTATHRLRRRAPDAALHIALGDAHRMKYLKRFWNVFAPSLGRNRDALKSAHAFFEDCHCAYANTSGYVGGHTPLHALRGRDFGQPVGILPRLDSIRLAKRPRAASGGFDGCQILPCYVNTYSPAHAVYVATQHLSSSWDRGIEIAERGEGVVKLVTVVDPTADIPTSLAKALVEFAHLDLMAEPFLLYILVDGAARWEEGQALALQQRLASSLVDFGEGHHVLSPNRIFFAFPASRTQLVDLLREMDVLLGLELGYLDGPINQLALAMGLRLLSMEGDGVDRLLPRVSEASLLALSTETRFWLLSKEAGHRSPVEFSFPAPGSLRISLKEIRRGIRRKDHVERRRDSFEASISELGTFFRGFAEVRVAR
jgi:hypothetical protein